MSNDGMKNRGRALEEEWARKQNADAIEKMKKGAGDKSDASKPKKAAGANCKCSNECACSTKEKGCGCNG